MRQLRVGVSGSNRPGSPQVTGRISGLTRHFSGYRQSCCRLVLDPYRALGANPVRHPATQTGRPTCLVGRPEAVTLRAARAFVATCRRQKSAFSDSHQHNPRTRCPTACHRQRQELAEPASSCRLLAASSSLAMSDGGFAILKPGLRSTSLDPEATCRGEDSAPQSRPLVTRST